MLLRHQHRREPVNIDTDALCPVAEGGPAKSGVDEQGGVAGREGNGVAAAACTENGELHAIT
jgi:hypothetical protein